MVLRVARALLLHDDGDRRAGPKSNGGVFRLAAARGEAAYSRSGLGVSSGRPDHLSYCRTCGGRTETGVVRLALDSSRSHFAIHVRGFKEFVLDQLAQLNGLSCRAMFGGY